MSDETDEVTSAAVRHDVQRADAGLALAGQMKEQTSAFLDQLEAAIAAFRAKIGDGGG